MQKEERQRLIQKAKQTALTEYFRASGYKLRQHGHEVYVDGLPGHQLCINSATNQWFDHYTGAGASNNAVECLIQVLDKSFEQAVFELTGRDISFSRAEEFPKSFRPQYTSPPRPAKPEPTKKELKMPARAETMRQVFAYLCKTRGIPSAIVQELAHSGLLYQSEHRTDTIVNGQPKTYRNANAVFVHRDAKGTIIGAEIQGCNSDRRYKGIAPGTGASAFMFTPVPARDGKIRRAYIFESAIDLLSFYTFCENKSKLTGSVLVSMAGLKPSVPKQLQAHGIEIISCVDNDDAGRRFESENGFVRSEFVKQKLDHRGFKDWNELLTLGKNNPNATLIENPQQTQRPTMSFHRGKRA